MFFVNWLLNDKVQGLTVEITFMCTCLFDFVLVLVLVWSCLYINPEVFRAAFKVLGMLCMMPQVLRRTVVIAVIPIIMFMLVVLSFS